MTDTAPLPIILAQQRVIIRSRARPPRQPHATQPRRARAPQATMRVLFAAALLAVAAAAPALMSVAPAAAGPAAVVVPGAAAALAHAPSMRLRPSGAAGRRDATAEAGAEAVVRNSEGLEVLMADPTVRASCDTLEGCTWACCHYGAKYGYSFSDVVACYGSC